MLFYCFSQLSIWLLMINCFTIQKVLQWALILRWSMYLAHTWRVKFIRIAANFAIWLANLSLSIRVHTTLLALIYLSRNAFFSSRSEKSLTFPFDVDIVVKKNVKHKNRNVVCISYRQRVRVITLFPDIISLLFLRIERVCKSFWKESHLHNAARAFSSPSRWF